MKRASSDNETGFFRGINSGLKRSFTVGLFGILMGGSVLMDSSSPQRDTVEFNLEAQKANEGKEIAMRADKVDHTFSLSLDCLISFGGAKQINKMGLSKEQSLPLDLGIRQGGSFSNIFMVGQRAPGEPEGGRFYSGMGVGYDPAKKRYYMFSVRTENRTPDGAQTDDGEAGAVPYLVATTMSTLGLEDIMQGIRYSFEGMSFSMNYDSFNPDGGLQLKLACTAPSS